MGEFSHADDLELLRAAFPSWSFESRWVTTASGPDRCHYLAHKGELTLSSWSANDLATQVTAEQIAEALRGDGQS